MSLVVEFVLSYCHSISKRTKIFGGIRVFLLCLLWADVLFNLLSLFISLLC